MSAAALGSREKLTAILGDGWWPRRNRTGIRYVEGSCGIYRTNVMSTSMLEMSLLGVGTVPHLERDAWSMVKRQRQATNEYAPVPSTHVYFQNCHK